MNFIDLIPSNIGEEGGINIIHFSERICNERQAYFFLIDDSPDELEFLTIYMHSFGPNNILPFYCPFEALKQIVLY